MISNSDEENNEKQYNDNITLKYVEKNDIFDTLKDELICPICNDIFHDPYICMKCQKSICNQCLEKNEGKCNFNCENTNFSPDRNKNKILGKLYFQCSKGCGKIYTQIELKDHLPVCEGATPGFDNNGNNNGIKRIDRETAATLQRKGVKIPTKKIILLGPSGVGKTSIVNTFIQNQSDINTLSTVGYEMNYVNYQLSDGSYLNFQIIDTAGQEKFHSITPLYLKDVSGVVLLYDITRKESFPTKDVYFIDILKEQYPKRLPPVVLVGNKSDLEDKREITQEEAIEYATANKFLFKEASAANNCNVQVVFEELFEMINFEYKNDLLKESQRDSIQIHKNDCQKKKKRKHCCK